MTRMPARQASLLGALCLLGTLVSAQVRQTDRLKEVRVNGVTLHYLTRGSGSAVVFVHGARGLPRMGGADRAASAALPGGRLQPTLQFSKP
jgi:hypothetical protein